jgi:hypothetical protein
VESRAAVTAFFEVPKISAAPFTAGRTRNIVLLLPLSTAAPLLNAGDNPKPAGFTFDERSKMMFTSEARRLVRKLSTLLLLIAALAFVSSGSGARKASACGECYEECDAYYRWCQTHPGQTYEGCDFVRDCGSSSHTCYIQECVE